MAVSNSLSASREGTSVPVIVASRLVHSPSEPPVRYCARYSAAPVTALQLIVYVPSDRETLVPSGAG